MYLASRVALSSASKDSSWLELRVGHQQVSGGNDDATVRPMQSPSPATTRPSLLREGIIAGDQRGLVAAAPRPAGLARKARKASASGLIADGTITYNDLPYG